MAPQRVLACLRDGVAAAVREAQEVDVDTEVEVERLPCFLVRLTLLMTPAQTEGWVALRGRHTTEAAAEMTMFRSMRAIKAMVFTQSSVKIKKKKSN